MSSASGRAAGRAPFLAIASRNDVRNQEESRAAPKTIRGLTSRRIRTEAEAKPLPGKKLEKGSEPKISQRCPQASVEAPRPDLGLVQRRKPPPVSNQVGDIRRRPRHQFVASHAGQYGRRTELSGRFDQGF